MTDEEFELMVRTAGCKPTLQELGWMRWAFEKGIEHERDQHWRLARQCKCITHNNERYQHPGCMMYHTIKAVGYVGGSPTKPELFRGIWPNGEVVANNLDTSQNEDLNEHMNVDHTKPT